MIIVSWWTFGKGMEQSDGEQKVGQSKNEMVVCSMVTPSARLEDFDESH
jgi:hypothetical protein